MPKDTKLMNIGELASLTGVSSRTIRYYEELGILPEPERSPGGTRKYSKEYRFYVEGALALKDLGFTLEEIQLIGRMALGRSTTAKERQHVGAVVAEKMSGLEHRIRVLTRLRDVLLAESGGRKDMWDRVSGALALPDRTGTDG
jgi:DNA-binding transcriptional MerR regulator